MIERQVRFDGAMHSADAIQRAVYSLSDRISCDVTRDGSVFRCVVHMDDSAVADIDGTLADFRNAVLDETLRERVRGETEEVRNLILALAFSNTGLVDTQDA
jgi:His-Xaa-Ser system protein HxsD